MDHYLKAELEQYVRSRPEIFEFVQGALDGLWYWNLEQPDDGWVSPRFKQILGYEDHEVPNTSSWWKSRVEPEDFATALQRIEEYIDHPHSSYDQTLPYRHKDGCTVWIRCRALVLRDSSGRAIRLLGVHTDVTAQRNASEARSSLEVTREYYERFRLLTDSLPQLVWTCTSDGHCDYLSRQWLDYTGTTAETQVGFGWLEQVHPGDRGRVHVAWQQAVESRKEFGVEFRIRRHDGAYRWFDTRAVPLRDRQGQIRRWFGSNTDITERRAAAEQLQKSEGRIQTVISNMTEGLVISSLDGQLLHWNPAGLAMHGFDNLTEYLKKLPEFESLFELALPDGPVLAIDQWPLSRIFRGELVRDLKVRLRRKDVSWERVFIYNGGVVREDSGERLAFLTITDVTERENAIRALVQSEQRLRVANEVGGIGTYDIDLRTRRVSFSSELCAIFGLSPGAELDVREAVRLIHPDDLPKVEERFAKALAPGADDLAAFDVRVIKAGGEVCWLCWSNRILFDEGHEVRIPIRAVGACFDVTAHRLSERRLSTHNAVSSALAETSNADEAAGQVMRAICESEGWDFGAVWQLDEERRYLRCSQVWHRPELDMVELVEETRAQVIGPGVSLPGRVWSAGRPMLIRDIGTDSAYLRTAAALKCGLRSALAFPILLRGQVTGVVGFSSRTVHGSSDELLETFAPVSHQLGSFFERKRAEAERQHLQRRLLQSQKMEALGQLSGGIAHDFNNMLAAILGNAELAFQELRPDNPVRDNLRAIEEASQRAKQLVLQILTFARQQHQERRVVVLAPLLEESAALLRATLPASVELAFKAQPAVPPIMADPTQFQQVLLNLVTNAWHALDAGRGSITIEVSGVTLDSEQARALSGVRPGRFARMSVTDDGRGMEASVVDRIFEPFFTTKGAGHGTGLGLSVALGIIQNHEGAIQVSTEPGCGSTFVVYFPAAPEPVPSELVEPRSSTRGTGQRILYVDDERQLIAIAQRALGRLGYTVSGFTSPALALEAFRAEPHHFSVVVTDMNMPQLSGLQLALQIRSLRADTPIVLLSGHITDELKTKAKGAGVNYFLYKPCTMQELSEIVQRAIAPDRSEASPRS